MSGKSTMSERDFWRTWAAKRVRIIQDSWLRAARLALAGDMRDLRLRVELAEAPPVQLVLSPHTTPTPADEPPQPSQRSE